MCPRTKASFPRRVYLIQQPEQAVSGVVRGGAQRIQEPIPFRRREVVLPCGRDVGPRLSPRRIAGAISPILCCVQQRSARVAVTDQRGHRPGITALALYRVAQHGGMGYAPTDGGGPTSSGAGYARSRSYRSAQQQRRRTSG